MCHTSSPLNYMTANNSSFKYKITKMYDLYVTYSAFANIIEPIQQSTIVILCTYLNLTIKMFTTENLV